MYENLATLQPVILAGHNSSRMGYNKVFAKFGDQTLIETIYTMLAFSFEKDPIIVTDNKTLFDKFEPLKDATVVEDKYPGHHTLGGVATAFEATDAENLFVIGVDMPFLSLVVLDRMVEAQGVAQVVVPILNGKDICLHAIYNRKLLPIMKEKIAAGEKLLHSFYKEVPLLQLPLKENTLEADIFIDINTPEDLNMLKNTSTKSTKSIRIKYSCIIRKNNITNNSKPIMRLRKSIRIMGFFALRRILVYYCILQYIPGILLSVLSYRAYRPAYDIIFLILYMIILK